MCLQYTAQFLTFLPWAVVRMMSWALNRWQKLWWPFAHVSGCMTEAVDRRFPRLLAWYMWAYWTFSLALHVVDVAVKLAMLKVRRSGFKRMACMRVWCKGRQQAARVGPMGT